MNLPLEPASDLSYALNATGVDWSALKSALAADRFDNGRSPDQLRRAFENSFAVCMVRAGDRVVGTARVLSDGVSNAYLVDVWTLSSLRRRGIAREMIRQLCSRLAGQHIYLQADADVADVYRRLGFREQPLGLSQVVGTWLAGQ
jgi:ribosomal protein S18 acetylase RimI-like enzyme